MEKFFGLPEKSIVLTCPGGRIRLLGGRSSVYPEPQKSSDIKLVASTRFNACGNVLVGSREPVVLLPRLLREQHPDGVNAEGRAKWGSQQRQKSDDQAQHARPGLPLKQSPGQHQVRHAKERQQPADRIKSDRQKIKRPVRERHPVSPARQKRQHSPSYENRSHLHEAQNSGREPQRGQKLNVPLNPSVGDRPGRGSRSCDGRRANRLPARTAELRAGGKGCATSVAKHGVSLLYQTIRQARREGSSATRHEPCIIPHLPPPAKPNLASLRLASWWKPPNSFGGAAPSGAAEERHASPKRLCHGPRWDCTAAQASACVPIAVKHQEHAGG